MKAIALVGLVFCAACLSGRSHQRDDRLYREIARQERWASDAVAGRATADDLARIRQGDSETATLARKQLRKLIASADRGTWIREAVAEAAREEGEDPKLAADFDKAAHTRSDAYLAADDLAEALAETRGGVSLADLRSGLQSYEKARASDERLAPQVAKLPTLAKLPAAPLPVPKPFIAAAARVAFAQHDQKLEGFSPQDAAAIHAAVAELEKNPPAPAPVPAQPAAQAESADRSPPPGGSPDRSPTLADQKAATLTIANDAQKLIAKRGAPQSFATRADGLFALRYLEQRPCGVESCPTEVDYLFDASGKLVRDEAAPRKAP